MDNGDHKWTLSLNHEYKKNDKVTKDEPIEVVAVVPESRFSDISNLGIEPKTAIIRKLWEALVFRLVNK